MGVSGVVRVLYDDEGWGVIDSPDTPGGCWAHFTSVQMPGYRALRAGQPVTLDYEPPGQDGYSFRAIEVWPTGQAPDRTGSETPDASDAYRSSLTLSRDEPEPPGPS
jgi:cold shock protein